jgi:hypothetical protein
MKRSLLILALVTALATPGRTFSEELGPWEAALVLATGINVITGTINGIQTFKSEPKTGPVVVGLISGFGSLAIGVPVILTVDSETDHRWYSLGIAGAVTGLAAMTLSLLNIDKTVNRDNKWSVEPVVHGDRYKSMAYGICFRARF